MLELGGLDWDVLDFLILSCRMKVLEIDLFKFVGLGFLYFFIDSIGIKVEGEGEWICCKYGVFCKCIWCKIYIGIDVEILDICVIEVIVLGVGDVLVLFDLLN